MLYNQFLCRVLRLASGQIDMLVGYADVQMIMLKNGQVIT